MSDAEPPPGPDLTAIEGMLRSLSPARSPIDRDRDRLMFEAGRRSARPTAIGRLGWPAVAASLALVAIGEGGLLAHRPGPRIVDRVVVVREPAGTRLDDLPAPDEPAPVVILHQSPEPPRPRPEPAWPGGSDMARLRRRVLQLGLDGLPESPPLAIRPATGDQTFRPDSAGDLLRSEIARLLNLGEPS